MPGRALAALTAATVAATGMERILGGDVPKGVSAAEAERLRRTYSHLMRGKDMAGVGPRGAIAAPWWAKGRRWFPRWAPFSLHRSTVGTLLRNSRYGPLARTATTGGARALRGGKGFLATMLGAATIDRAFTAANPYARAAAAMAASKASAPSSLPASPDTAARAQSGSGG